MTSASKSGSSQSAVTSGPAANTGAASSQTDTGSSSKKDSTGTYSQSGILGSQLAATQVTFNGVPGPLLYTSGGAIAAIVPYEVAGADRIAVQVTYSGQVSSVQNVPATTAVPGVFSADASGSGPGAILNSDYSLNTPDNPATGGDFAVGVSVFGVDKDLM